jgi:hypothetical protein
LFNFTQQNKNAADQHNADPAALQILKSSFHLATLTCQPPTHQKHEKLNTLYCIPLPQVNGKVVKPSVTVRNNGRLSRQIAPGMTD